MLSSISRVDSRYAAAESCCSCALGPSGAASSVTMDEVCPALSGAGCCCAARASLTTRCASLLSRSRSARRSSSSTTSWRNSPSVLNKRRSVTTNSGFFSLSAIGCLLAEGKGPDGGALLPDLHRSAGRCGFAPRVAERQRPLATGKWNPRHAGYLSHILVVGANFGPRRRKLASRMSLHFEAGEHAMHVAARANSLHDLLPDVAALGEIQRVLLSSFLRQIAFPKINCKARYSSDDAIEFEGIAAPGREAGRDQRIPDCVHVLGSEPDLESIHLRLRATRDGNPNIAPHCVDHLPRFELRDVQTGRRQYLTRLRAGHANRAQLVADVGDLDIVHDDVPIEDLGDRRRLLAVGGDQQVIAAVVGNQVSLNAPLRAKHEAVHSMPRRQVADVVSDHAIQPAHAVLSGQHQLGLPAHVEEGAAL